MNSRKQHKMTSSIDKLVLGLLSAGLITACGSTGPTKYTEFAVNDQDASLIQSKPSYLQPSFTKLIKEGKRNQVLNLMHIGKVALQKNDIDEAEMAFEQALVQIETVYANNKQAEQARSLWYEEGGKDFKGEPYERAMVYFYRGIIYLIRNEFDNARATFLSGLMQDAFAEEEQNRSDFALLMFMAGWSAQKMGAPDLANEAYQELAVFRPDFTPPSADQDTIVIAETGKSPRKLADGVGHYQLVFRRGKRIKDTRVDLVSKNERHALYPMEDIYWQATSRGGRPFDSIIEGKVSFKQSSANFGSGLSNVAGDAMVISGGFGSNSGTNAGAALSLIGVAAMAMSANAKTRADTRYWNNLPDLVHVMTFNSNDLGAPDMFEYKDGQGTVLFSKQADVVHTSTNQTIIWSSNGG